MLLDTLFIFCCH